MKINPNFNSFGISAKGMSAQKKKMDLIAENIANSNTTRTDDGEVYRRKFLAIEQDKSSPAALAGNLSLTMKSTSSGHFGVPAKVEGSSGNLGNGVKTDVIEDSAEGEKVLMPDHPDADDDGYVTMPNVNVVTEMVEMIAATRSYEANLTAFNSTKQIAKDALEIGR